MQIFDVLLATYNGEKYIDEFLKSLANQDSVEINLYVSDDNSIDSTISKIVEKKNNFKSLTLLKGPNSGPKDNFFNLIRNGSRNPCAYADQDDIWLPTKLKRASDEINKHKEPFLFIGGLQYSDGKELKSNFDNMPRILMRNGFQGCRMALNNELRVLLCELNHKNIIMHDWASVIIAKCIGTLHSEDQISLIYRIHDDNFLGRPSLLKKFMRYFWSILTPGSRSLVYIQALEIYNSLGDRFTKDTNKVYLDWIKGTQENFINRAKYSLINRKILLQSPSDFLNLLQIISGAYKCSQIRRV